MINSNCSKCSSIMQPISPDGKIVACQQCGLAVNELGEVVNVDKDQMIEMLSMASKVIADSFSKELPHATKVILTARTIEYGMSMWQDGLRQGMLLGLKQELRK